MSEGRLVKIRRATFKSYYRGEAEYRVWLDAGEEKIIVVRWLADEYGPHCNCTREQYEREYVGAVGFVRLKFERDRAIPADIYGEFVAWIAAEGYTENITLRRGYYTDETGWIEV
jgi:hypothetical protein